MHLLAAAALWLGQIPDAARLIILPIVILSAAWQWRPQAPLRVRLGDSGDLRVLGDDGAEQPARLLADSHVSPWLVVMRYRLPGQRRTRRRVILPDSLAAEDFRRLRVWLRWRGQAPGATALAAERP